jgi:hypothetical protein
VASRSLLFGCVTLATAQTSRLRLTLQELAETQRDPDLWVIMRDDGRPASKRVIDGWL